MTTLKELKELEAKATSAPWGLSDNISYDEDFVIKASDWLWIAKVCKDGNNDRECTESEQSSNAKLITAARNALSDLIRVIELAEDALLEIEHSDECAQIIATKALTEIRKLKGE